MAQPVADFEEYISSNWDSRVPTDCTKLNVFEDDCLSRGDIVLCSSCSLYLQLAERFARLGRVR